jgi:hypothetical protein
MIGDKWYTFEEVVNRSAVSGFKHGYNYAIPAYADGPVKAVPLPNQGRFVHEAVAELDGILYETEDRRISEGGAVFYRFVPDGWRRGDDDDDDDRRRGRGGLDGPGTLQGLKLRDQPNANMDSGRQVGRPYPVEWVTIDEPDHDDDTGNRVDRVPGFTPTRYQAQERGPRRRGARRQGDRARPQPGARGSGSPAVRTRRGHGGVGGGRRAAAAVRRRCVRLRALGLRSDVRPPPSHRRGRARRVARPGGAVAMANWSSTRLMGRVLDVAAKLRPLPRAVPQPSRWGRYEGAFLWLGAVVDDFQMSRRRLPLHFANPGAAWEALSTEPGPLAGALAGTSAERCEEARTAVLELAAAGDSAGYVIVGGRART